MDSGFDFVQNLSRADQPEVHLVRPRTISDFQVPSLLQLKADGFLDSTFSKSDNPVGAAFAHGQAAADFSQNRQHRFLEHRLKFAWGAGQQKQVR